MIFLQVLSIVLNVFLGIAVYYVTVYLLENYQHRHEKTGRLWTPFFMRLLGVLAGLAVVI